MWHVYPQQFSRSPLADHWELAWQSKKCQLAPAAIVKFTVLAPYKIGEGSVKTIKPACMAYIYAEIRLRDNKNHS